MEASDEQPELDHLTIDWSQVSSATYRIRQDFRYEYPQPIRDLRHRLVVVPRARHGGQECLAHQVEVLPQLPVHQFADAFGNRVFSVTADFVDKELTFRHYSRVRHAALTPGHLTASDLLADPELRIPRRLTRPDEALWDHASDLRRIYPDRRELAAAVARFVHTEIAYTKGETDVFTTASVAFAMRRGVCQDYAHVMLALVRACGFPARYVSGHLLGEGATHAWVEVLLPAGRDRAAVLAFDPTHGCMASLRHIVVAVGRDYDDIAPTSGTFSAPRAGRLHATCSVAATGVTLI